jgi:hypothetical protein
MILTASKRDDMKVAWSSEKQWEQYVCLARLAWLLGSYLGIPGSVQVTPGQPPIVTAGRYRIWAVPVDDRAWLYRWGQGHDQWISAQDESAAARFIAQVVG